MSPQDQTSKEIAALHSKVKDLLKQEYTDDQIIGELKKDGIEEHYTRLIIDNVHNDKSDKISFRNSLIMGTFYIGAGLLLNILSYTIAVQRNSTYFYLFWGIVALGIVTIVRGFILHKK